MNEHLRIARLDPEAVDRIQALEEELGTHIMAYEPAVKIAHLTPEQLARLRAVEQALGVTLLAYDK